MKIEKLNNSEDIINFISPEAKALKELIGFLEGYFKNKNENTVLFKECSDCKGCLLEFYYYIKNGGNFRNGVWIRIDKSDKWIFVLSNANDKAKTVIYSSTNLNCLHYPQNLHKENRLPMDFDKPAFYEDQTVAQMDFEELMAEIKNRLKCICQND